QQGAEHTTREMLRKMGRQARLETIEEHRVADDKQARIRALCHQYQGALEKRRAAQTLRDRLDRALHAEKARFANSPVTVDFSELALVHSKLQSSPQLESEVANHQDSVDQKAAEAAICLKRLGLWTGSLEELEALPIPSVESIEHFEAGFRDLEADD